MNYQLFFVETSPGKKGEQLVDPAQGEWVTIGRSSQCNITRRFVNGSVSRIHASVSWDGEKWLVLDGTASEPSSQGVYSRLEERLVTVDLAGNLRPITLREPGDVVHILLKNDKGEAAALVVKDPAAKLVTSEPPTLRLGEQIEEARSASEEARLQSQKNGQDLTVIRDQNKKQEEKLGEISKGFSEMSKGLESARDVVEFAVWLSAYGKQIIRATVIAFPSIFLLLFLKYLAFDGGMKNLFDHLLPPIGQSASPKK